MATPSAFDPQQRDPEFYSKDAHKQGDSDYGQPSEGVGAGNTSYSGTSGMDMDADNQRLLTNTREAHKHEADQDAPAGESLGTTEEWDVSPEVIKDGDQPKGRMMSDEAAAKLEQIADNPSDDALFHRQDATYLEAKDKPSEGYDPHDKGYTGKDKNNAQ
jgi:hypothetical protein